MHFWACLPAVWKLVAYRQKFLRLELQKVTWHNVLAENGSAMLGCHDHLQSQNEFQFPAHSGGNEVIVVGMSIFHDSCVNWMIKCKEWWEIVVSFLRGYTSYTILID